MQKLTLKTMEAAANAAAVSPAKSEPKINFF